MHKLSQPLMVSLLHRVLGDFFLSPSTAAELWYYTMTINTCGLRAVASHSQRAHFHNGTESCEVIMSCSLTPLLMLC